MAGTTIDEDNVYKTVQKAVNEYGYNVSRKRCCNMEQEKKTTSHKRCIGKLYSGTKYRTTSRDHIYILPEGSGAGI